MRLIVGSSGMYVVASHSKSPTTSRVITTEMSCMGLIYTRSGYTAAPEDLTVMPEEQMHIAVIGTGDGGIKPGVQITPAGQPNVVYQVVGPVFAIFVRFVNTYLTLLVGVVTAGMTSDLLPVSDFHNLIIFAAKLSLSGAVVGLLKDCLTVFGRLENKFPLLTGNV